MFDIIIKQRNHGKTHDLIAASHFNGIPILTNNPSAVKRKAQSLGMDIPEPISWYNLNAENPPVKCYVDELESFLKHYVGIDPVACTISNEEEFYYGMCEDKARVIIK